MSYKIKNAVQIKKFADYYKITVCKNITKGMKTTRHTPKGKAGNTEKLSQSISRSRKQVLEKALCNEWHWFVTLTLDPKRYERDNLKIFIKDLGQFIRDYRKKHTAFQIKYLLIPELHADGKNWHMHGLLSELPWDDIEPHPVRELSEKGYFNWAAYEKKFGFNSMGAIRDPVKCSLYITKYITKDLDRSVTALNQKLYYSSRGLKTAEVVEQGRLTEPLDFHMDFEGLYSKSQFVDSYAFFEKYYIKDDLDAH
ncbi:rolling circle replication-associated protein [Eubacterium maltosivorans]|uniref:rolling circle replication-associated protein n=1 Tax=Eubacterium maltosivorans TaxID=2041044 RepID=UPI0018A10E76|nr:hypothetical protein [Eubacterium maltosivorans]